MYSSYFGFTKQPFRDSGPQIYPVTPAYEQARDGLRRGLDRGAALLVITGPGGTGKTALLQRLMTELDESIQCIFSWNAHLGFDDLLDYLNGRLDLRAEGPGRARRIEVLHAYLVDRLEAGVRTVLVLDDAQNLPTETLRGLHDLIRLESRGQHLLQIVLSGQPEIGLRLEQDPALTALHQRITVRCHLPTLTDRQVIAYIREQVRASGRAKDDLFDADALHKIIACAHGVPRVINLICSQALLLAYLNGEDRIGAAMIREVVVTRQSLGQAPSDVLSAEPPARLPATVPVGPAAGPLQPRVPAQLRLRSRKKSGSASVIEPAPGPAAHRSARSSADSPTELGAGADRRSALVPLTRLTAIVAGVAAAAVLVAPHLNPASETDRLPWPLSLIVARASPPRPAGMALGAVDMQSINVSSQPPAALATIPDAGESLATPEAETTLPADTDTSPAPSAAAAPAQNADTRIRNLLDLADDQVAALRYTRPAGRNAFNTYRRILSIDPDNREARRGIAFLKSRFLQWADTALARGSLNKAENHLETALVIDPRDRAIRARLDDIRRRQALARQVAQPREGMPPRRSQLLPRLGYGWSNRD